MPYLTEQEQAEWMRQRDETDRNEQVGIIAVVILSLTIIVGLVVFASVRDDNGTAPAVESSECMEDAPCWDCATMGNQICGPVE